jgi:DNA-binding NarL/FixJ family response regulator
LRAVGAGYSNKEIANRLTVSEGTVKSHMKSILPKLNARDRAHAVMIAVKRGMPGCLEFSTAARCETI